MSPYDLFTSRCQQPRRCGEGMISRCPAHEDHVPSLSHREAPDGRVLVHCFGGCSVADVVRAMGLRLSDLFPARDLDPVEARYRISILDAGNILRKDAMEVALCAAAMDRGEVLDAASHERLRQVVRRMIDIKVDLHGTM